MAAKTKIARWEVEIEKFRSEGNWGKVLDTVRQISSRSGIVDVLSQFVHAECTLERHLLAHPPGEENHPLAREELRTTHQELLDVSGSEHAKGTMKEECVFLMAKLQYAQGDYRGALDRLQPTQLEQITVDNSSNRRLKIVSEAFAIKGLCLEKLPNIKSSKYKQAEKDELVLRCFEKSGDLALIQLQKLSETGKNTPTSTLTGVMFNMDTTDVPSIGPIVETAIQRSPILYIRQGELTRGIGRFRELLQAVETRAVQDVRQILARQLAEVLMRGVCPTTYEKLDLDSIGGSLSPSLKMPGSTGSLSRTASPPRGLSPKNSGSPQKPKKYAGRGHKKRKSNSNSLFIPTTQTEEVLILLLISESMTTRNAVLSRYAEHKEMRVKTFQNSTAVYDLLTLTLVRRAQFDMLSETFDLAMKFSFNEFHTWYQFALSLICAEKYNRAYCVLKQCVRLQPDNPTPLLHISQLCYEHLHQYKEGVEYAEKVVNLEQPHTSLGRGYVYLGVGYSLCAEESKLQHDRQNYQKQAMNAFIKAQSVDPDDYLAEFHLAHQRAMLRQIPEALHHVKRALFLRSDHLGSLHLLVLLLTAQKRPQEALDLLEAALSEYPDNFNLLFTKSHLEESLSGNALSTCQQLLELWKQSYEPSIDIDTRSGIVGLTTPKGLAQLHLQEFNDKESAGSLHADSVAASRLEHALSEVASSINSSCHPKMGSQQTWLLQLQIWLHLAEMYLNMGSFDQSYHCIQEASSIYPISHLVSYMRGRFHELRGDFNEAKGCYQNAISINPAHVPSLQHLGKVLHILDCDHLAEKVLRDAVNMDPMSCETWSILGNVLESVGEFEASAECLTTVVNLEATNPIVPFSVIHKVLH